MVCINMTAGNTKATPANASVPSFPTKKSLDETDGRLSQHDEHVGCRS
jgi:hypothetical protein